MQILSDSLLQAKTEVPRDVRNSKVPYTYIYHKKFDTLYCRMMIFKELPPALPDNSLCCKSFKRR